MMVVKYLSFCCKEKRQIRFFEAIWKPRSTDYSRERAWSGIKSQTMIRFIDYRFEVLWAESLEILMF